MAILVGVQIEVIQTLTNEPLVRVQSSATVQVPLPALLGGSTEGGSGVLVSQVIEKMVQDATEKAVEQAHQAPALGH